MKSQIIFIIKVFLWSTLLSFLVKYGGRLLPIQANNLLALTIVFLPALILSLILVFINRKKQSIS